MLTQTSGEEGGVEDCQQGKGEEIRVVRCGPSNSPVILSKAIRTRIPYLASDADVFTQSCNVGQSEYTMFSVRVLNLEKAMYG